jgi:hypothetical protein
MSGLLKTPRSLKGAKAVIQDEVAGIELIAEDGESMDSDWHHKAIGVLVNSIN